MHRNKSRKERKNQVVIVFKIHLQHGGENMLTMRQIAKRLELEPTQRVTDMLQEMVQEGRLMANIGNSASGFIRYEYSLIDEGYVSVEKRTIPIRSKGETKGQMAL